MEGPRVILRALYKFEALTPEMLSMEQNEELELISNIAIAFPYSHGCASQSQLRVEHSYDRLFLISCIIFQRERERCRQSSPWWCVKKGERHGWVPSNYVTKVDGSPQAHLCVQSLVHATLVHSLATLDAKQSALLVKLR